MKVHESLDFSEHLWKITYLLGAVSDKGDGPAGRWIDDSCHVLLN